MAHKVDRLRLVGDLSHGNILPTSANQGLRRCLIAIASTKACTCTSHVSTEVNGIGHGFL